MPDQIDKLSFHLWTHDRGPYALLMLLVFTLFILAPLLSARLVAPAVLEIAFAVILLSGAFIVSSRVIVRLPVTILALVSVILNLLGMSVTGRLIVTVDSIVSVGMLFLFALLMAKRFLGGERALSQRIAGAVTIYLLVGLIWSRFYYLVELISPGSFHVTEGETLSAVSLTYFSFVTLATLGYGDIVPVHIIARDLAILEAIIGQLYLVILISGLVSKGTAQSANTP